MAPGLAIVFGIINRVTTTDPPPWDMFVRVKMVVLGLASLLAIVAGLGLGISALFHAQKYRATQVLVPALIGTVIDALLLVGGVWGILMLLRVAAERS